MDFAHRTFLVKYLGCPLYVRRRKIEFFSESIVSQVLSWNNCLLSTGRKTVLIKHVLASIPIHFMATTNPPKGILKKIEKVFEKLWNVKSESFNHHWIKWVDLCVPPDEEELDLDLCQRYMLNFQLNMVAISDSEVIMGGTFYEKEVLCRQSSKYYAAFYYPLTHVKKDA